MHQTFTLVFNKIAILTFSKLVCCVLTIFLFSGVCFAQNSSFDEVVALYNNAFTTQLLIYNGHPYKNFPEPFEGSPIFGDDLWNKGTVEFEGQVYQNIDLFYDTYRDVLVLEHFNEKGHSTFFIPPAEKVSSFSLDDAKFITLPVQAIEKYGLPYGYFQKLYVGALKLYAKRKTELHDVPKQGKYMPTFEVVDKFFIKYNGEFFEVKNKSSLRKKLKEYRPQINHFSRENHLKFLPEDREESFIRLIRYLDKIIQTGGTQ